MPLATVVVAGIIVVIAVPPAIKGAPTTVPPAPPATNIVDPPATVPVDAIAVVTVAAGIVIGAVTATNFAIASTLTKVKAAVK